MECKLVISTSCISNDFATLSKNKEHAKDREVEQWVHSTLLNWEDLSLNPQHPCKSAKKPEMSELDCNPSSEGWRQVDLERACYPTSLPEKAIQVQ